MASSKKQTGIAFVAEVARFLTVEPADVERMIKLEKLPALRVLKETRRVYRIPLMDFHAWLLGRTVNPTPHLANYETFLAQFDLVRVSGKGRKRGESTANRHDENQ